MSDSVVVDVDALAVECPSCGMQPRHSCCANLGLGESMSKPHVARVRDALIAERDSLHTALSAAHERIAGLEDLRDRQANHIAHLVMAHRGKDWHEEVISLRSQLLTASQERDEARAERDELLRAATWDEFIKTTDSLRAAALDVARLEKEVADMHRRLQDEFAVGADYQRRWAVAEKERDEWRQRAECSHTARVLSRGVVHCQICGHQRPERRR